MKLASPSAQLPFATPGRAVCGTVMVADVDTACADYVTALGLQLCARGTVPPVVAASWGAPALAGRQMALLQPATGLGSFIRLVAGTPVPQLNLARCHGWAALEISVRDVWRLHEQLVAHGVFEILGAPKLVDGFTNFIPMQVRGRNGEVLYLNQVLQSMSTLDLPPAHADVDSIFITVLAAPDRAAALDHYVRAIGFEAGPGYDIVYSTINRAFDLPADTRSALSMTCVGRLPGLEIDQYPAGAVPRPCPPGELPPGIGLVSFHVASLDAIAAPFVAPPVRLPGPDYAGRLSACVRGAAGELVELIVCNP